MFKFTTRPILHTLDCVNPSLVFYSSKDCLKKVKVLSTGKNHEF